MENNRMRHFQPHFSLQHHHSSSVELGAAYPTSSAFFTPITSFADFRTTQTNGNKKPVKVPSDKTENRSIKEQAQFEEDDNEDMPVGIASILSCGFFLFAFCAMEIIDHLSFERFALNQLLYTYGKTLGFCNNTFPYEKGMWPSFLRQVEMKVLTNVCFRVAVCVPMTIRIFVAFIIRNSTRENSLVQRNALFQCLNEISAFVSIVEIFSLALFSIVTIRFDYPHFYNAMFGSFVLSATLYMFIRTTLTFSADELEPIEQLAGAIRLLCTILFTWTASQVFQTHQHFIKYTGCHGYVRPADAIEEYVAIFAYGLFSLLQLIDIRNIRFICYPRSCSGECEPLRPENFKKGGKFEHCRAFEWSQRQNINEYNEDAKEEIEEFPTQFSVIGLRNK